MATTTTYYLVRDEGEEILAIHRTPDSAAVTLAKLTKKGTYQRLELEKVTVDQWGIVLSSEVAFRWAGES
jgi:hypothetical protein